MVRVWHHDRVIPEKVSQVFTTGIYCKSAKLNNYFSKTSKQARIGMHLILIASTMELFSISAFCLGIYSHHLLLLMLRLLPQYCLRVGLKPQT